MGEYIFVCEECKLNFPNVYLLERHKKRFCLENHLKENRENFASFPTDHQQFEDLVQKDIRRQATELENQREDLLRQLRGLPFGDGRGDQLQKPVTRVATTVDNQRDRKSLYNDNKANSSRFQQYQAWNTQQHFENVEENTENRLLTEARQMHKEYLQNGGDDYEVLQYFNRLYNEVSNLTKKVNPNHVNKQSSPQPTFIPPRVDHHQQRLTEIRQETEYYRQQLELEHLRQELNFLRGHPNKPVLPSIGENYGRQQNQPSLTQQLTNMTQHTEHNQINSPFNQKQHFEMAPYDPASGFTVFWDFINMPQLSDGLCQLTVTLYRDDEAMTQTQLLPSVPYGRRNVQRHSRLWKSSKQQQPGLAVLGVKQDFQKCYPDETLSLVVCLRVTDGDINDGHSLQEDGDGLVDYGWCKIKLFDLYNRAISGRWKVPIRVLPIRPSMSIREMNTLIQLGQSEVLLRVINTRDVVHQQQIIIDKQLMHLYKYPSMVHESERTGIQTTLQAALPPPPLRHARVPQATKKQRHPSSNIIRETTSRPQSKVYKHRSRHSVRASPKQRHGYSSDRLVVNTPKHQHQEEQGEVLNENEDVVLSTPEINLPSLDGNIGIQLDKIIDLVYDEEIKVVLSIRNPDGQVSFCDNEGGMFTSTWIKPTFLHRVVAFALQKKYFTAVQLFQWSALHIQVFAHNNEQHIQSLHVASSMSMQGASSDDKLIAWSVFTLFKPSSPSSSSSAANAQSLNEDRIRYGHFHLQLYKPPMPPAKSILHEIKNARRTPFQASAASLSLYLFKNEEDRLVFPKSLPPVPLKKDIPQNAWIEYQRKPLTRLFKNGDGFDFYLDAARFLPDSTVCTKIVVGLFEGQQSSNNKSPFTKTMEIQSSLHNSAEQPIFDSRFEFREFAYDSQSKLVFIVYFLCSVTKKVHLYGYAILPLFVEANTFHQPSPSNLEYCLNEGGIQLPLHRYLDDHVTYNQDKLRGAIPCSSLLVRLLRASCYPDGQCKTKDEIPESEWLSEGLLVPMPRYEDVCYDSVACRPMAYEVELLHQFVERETQSVEEKVQAMIADEGKKAKSSIDWLKIQFKALEHTIFCMNFFVKYNSLHGVFIRLERSQNLSWNGLTFATFCVGPPFSFYEGITDDPIMLVTNIHGDSLVRHVTWTDDLKIFPRREYNANLLVMVQLYEVTVVGKEGNIRFNPQAWTLLPLTALGYPLHGFYQIPLFHSTPTQAILREIGNHPLIPAITTLRKKKALKVMDASSVYIRVGDARRVDDGDALVTKVADKSFLPKNNKYVNVVKSKPIQAAVPSSSSFQEFAEQARKQFENFIFRDFEQRSKVT